MERLRMQLMRDTNLYNPALMDKSLPDGYGEIPGYRPGATFPNREALSRAGVHAATVAGIHGCKTGAYSVCLSGGYEDDEDRGDFFWYTGTGGQKDAFGGENSQVGDQSFDHQQNAWLKTSVETGYPVRVVRGFNLQSKYAPAEGFRYDGLYKVEKASYAKGASGHTICRFELRKIAGQPPIPVQRNYLAGQS